MDSQPIIFRNDDVNSNTNIKSLLEIYDILKTFHPNSRIISAITICGKKNNRGSVYDGVPFKDNPVPWFYNFDQFIDKKTIDTIPFEKASHGLFHIDHTKVSRETQLMSIYASCQYVGATMFVPPFNRWNEDTRDVCKSRGLKLISGEHWKNFEYEKFDPSHKYWYFHSWRFNKESIRKVLDGHSLNLAKL